MVGIEYSDRSQITINQIISFPNVIQPRISKFSEEQEQTKRRGEVFTPAWVCNLMNNLCDEEWFEKKDVFNQQEDRMWITNKEKVVFPDTKDWRQSVDSRRIEITCGEAPYLVFRYDASTGDYIKLHNRIGILDRKMRVVNENTENKDEWWKWFRAHMDMNIREIIYCLREQIFC